MSTRWMFCGRVLHADGAETALLMAARHPSNPLAASPALSRFLGRCNQFRSLDEHLHAFTRHPEDLAAVADECRRLLPELERRGLVQMEHALRQSLTLPHLEPAAPLRAVAMPSAGRPETARRALEALAAHAATAGRSPAAVLCDDSRTPEEAKTYQAMAASVRAQTGMPVFHLGPEAKARLRPLLARRAGLDPALVDFALADPLGSGFTCGANRNWSLLASAGLPLLSLDDDVVPLPCSSPKVSAGLRITGSSSPVPQRLLDPPSSASPSAAPPSGDLFSTIERWLGRPLRLQQSESAAFDALTPEHLHELAEGSARVLAVFHGCRGRPLINSTRPWLLLDGPSLDRLHTPAALDAFLADPWVEMVPPQATLSRCASFLGPCMALDNRRPWAPFFPAFHAEDAIMASVWNAALPGTWTALLPATLDHLPPHWQGSAASGQMAASCVDECFLLTRHWVNTAAPALQIWDHAEDRMARLGHYLAALGAWDAPAFAQACASAAQAQAGTTVQRMSRMRTALPSGHALHDTIASHIAHAGALCQQPEAAVPSDLARAFGPRAWSAYQSMLANYGRLLEAWPVLWEAARSWRAEAGMENPGLPGAPQ